MKYVVIALVAILAVVGIVFALNVFIPQIQESPPEQIVNTQEDDDDNDPIINEEDTSAKKISLADLLNDIEGYTFDGAVDCDLNGDGTVETVIFFTGQNQTDYDLGKIPTGWDLGAYTLIGEEYYLIWFNVDGSTQSLQIHSFDDGREGVLVVVPGNVEEETFLLYFEENELKITPK